MGLPPDFGQFCLTSRLPCQISILASVVHLAFVATSLTAMPPMRIATNRSTIAKAHISIRDLDWPLTYAALTGRDRESWQKVSRLAISHLNLPRCGLWNFQGAAMSPTPRPTALCERAWLVSSSQRVHDRSVDLTHPGAPAGSVIVGSLTLLRLGPVPEGSAAAATCHRRAARTSQSPFPSRGNKPPE